MELKISAPCPMKWENLAGNERIRHCARCNLNVYNLAVMSQDEVARIVSTTEGRLCGRLYLRGDRTATLRDCAEGRSGIVKRRLRNVAIGIVAALFALVCRKMAGPDLSGLPKWARNALGWVGVEDRDRMVVGRICPTPRGPVPVPAPTTPTAGP